MPIFETTKQNQALLRCLAFGYSKTKKTWWAGTAAEAGYNVIHLSAERNGHAIFSQLSAAAQARIFVLDISDDFGKQSCAEFLTLFLGGRPFYWHETTKTYSWVPRANMIFINPANLTRDVVLTVDPWTCVCSSLVARYCKENNIDMSDAAKPDWSHYRWCGAFGTWLLTQLISLPCHFNLVAHTSVYEKRREEAGRSIIEWARMQVLSTSGPHAMSIAAKFDEVLHFEMSGPNHFIDIQSNANADGGGRFVAPARYPWGKLSYGILAKLAGIAPSAVLPPVASYFPAVTDDQLAQVAAKSHGLLNPAAARAPVKPAGIILSQPATASPLRL